jgi:hypothetical protein
MENNTSEIQEGDSSGSLHGGMISFPMLTLFQINRSAQLGSKPLAHDPISEDAFRNSVKILDKMMSYRKDEEYEQTKKKIMEMDEPKDAITTTEEFFELFGALVVKIIKTPGIAPYEEGTSYDTDDPIE